MNKSTLRERVSVTVRGYDILKEYCPGLASGKAASMLITTLQPFVSLWFSAQIINELTGQRRALQSCNINAAQCVRSHYQ